MITYALEMPGRPLAISTFDVGQVTDQELCKTMLEVSRDGSDLLTHFDFSIHDHVALEAGLSGHVACKATRIGNIPTNQDRSNRINWRLENNHLITG